MDLLGAGLWIVLLIVLLFPRALGYWIAQVRIGMDRAFRSGDK
jgi:hypothetical protein